MIGDMQRGLGCCCIVPLVFTFTFGDMAVGLGCQPSHLGLTTMVVVEFYSALAWPKCGHLPGGLMMMVAVVRMVVGRNV